MNGCEQGQCPFWAGTDGCVCAVVGVSATERRQAQADIEASFFGETEWDQR